MYSVLNKFVITDVKKVHSIQISFNLIIIKLNSIHCSQSIPEAVITAVPAPDDGCQQSKHVELPTEM